MSNTEKIIAEIQRLKKDLDGYSAKEALDYIESYINLIGREPLLPSDLDEAAVEFGKRQGAELVPFAKKFFKAGAEWQKERDKEVIEVAEDHALFAGMEQMREEMMKDAVGHLDPPGENGVDGMSYLKGWNDRWKSMENNAVVGYIRDSEGTHWIESKPDEKIHGKVGDEVKLIIVKEE